MHLNLAVVESRWWKRGNTSVRLMFDTLADLIAQNPSAYHYEMFNNAASLTEILERVGTDRRIRNLHLAAHGDGTSIYGGGNNRVSRTVIANALDRVASGGGSLDGLYLACCQVGNEDTIRFLLQPKYADRIKVRWVAGYEQPIDWIAAAAVELWFWNTYYRQPRRLTEAERIRRVVRQLVNFMPGAHTQLGFEVYVRKKGPKGGLVRLVANAFQGEMD